MNVVDSSGWLEFFADGRNADFFAPAIEAPAKLVVPTLSIFEVFERVLVQRGEADALQLAAQMHQGTVVPLDEVLALDAAKFSLSSRLPLAESVMLATARAHSATLWTQDADFEGLPDVRYVTARSDSKGTD